MSDSLLIEALDDTRILLREIEDDDAPATQVLRERVDMLDRASASLQLRRVGREQVVRLAKLAMQVRDEAVALRQHHRSVQQIIEKMMD